jgi:uncharacterized membrane protein
VDAQQFAAAYSLSTAIGLRAFVVLALASVAMHFGYLHPSPAFAWLGSNGATFVFAVLAVAELLSDKIPVLDHFMHAIHFATKPIAAAVLVGSMVPVDGDTLTPATYLAMGAGALNAFGVHTASATVRAGSTATTLGVANPFISLIEDVVAVVGTVLAVLLPLFAAALAVACTILVVLIARRVWRAAHA